MSGRDVFIFGPVPNRAISSNLNVQKCKTFLTIAKYNKLMTKHYNEKAPRLQHSQVVAYI